MRHFPYSRVAAPSLNLNGGMVWLSNTSADTTPTRHRPIVDARQVDGQGPWLATASNHSGDGR
jgi:hypothetical protein